MDPALIDVLGQSFFARAENTGISEATIPCGTRLKRIESEQTGTKGREGKQPSWKKTFERSVDSSLTHAIVTVKSYNYTRDSQRRRYLSIAQELMIFLRPFLSNRRSIVHQRSRDIFHDFLRCNLLLFLVTVSSAADRMPTIAL